MKRTYFCFKCKATLNPNNKLILAMAKGKRRNLILFSPQPGNYTIVLPPDVSLKTGDVVEFFCPACGSSLRSDANSKLAELGFCSDEGTQGHLLFSRKYGEHATFFVTKEEIRAYGENAELYGEANFFGAGGDD